jgi:hypothetical protein
MRSVPSTTASSIAAASVLALDFFSLTRARETKKTHDSKVELCGGCGLD